VVLGRSILVGKPLAQLLLGANATVTHCHSRTRDLPGVCREAEVLVAYELGYRMIPHERISLDLTGFYHRYHDVRSFVPLPPESSGGTAVVPFVVSNNARSRTVGGTANVTLRMSPGSRLRGTYTYLDQTASLEDDAPANAIPDVAPGLNPQHQLALWASFDLPESVELDVLTRYVSRLRIEPEVVARSEPIEVLPGITVPVAVTGDLTIRDVTKPVELAVTFEGFGINPWGVEVAGVSAQTKIDREEWGLTWNAALETGGVLVGKAVALEIEVQAARS
jgi:hypothetical protein